MIFFEGIHPTDGYDITVGVNEDGKIESIVDGDGTDVKLDKSDMAATQSSADKYFQD